MIDKPWKPDWVSISMWIAILAGTLLFYFMVIKPIVDFLR